MDASTPWYGSSIRLCWLETRSFVPILASITMFFASFFLLGYRGSGLILEFMKGCGLEELRIKLKDEILTPLGTEGARGRWGEGASKKIIKMNRMRLPRRPTKKGWSPRNDGFG